MDDKVINPFGSKEYHFLKWLSRHQTETISGLIIKFSQAELASEYGMSLAKINGMLQTLSRVGCVEKFKGGRYQITAIGNSVLLKMSEIEEIIGGKRNGH